MQTYVMMTRLAHGALNSPGNLDNLEHEVKARISSALDGNIKWVASYAVSGPYDYMDIFEAADNDAALKLSTIVRTFGHAHSEVWPATDWAHFKEMARNLPQAGA